MSDRLRRNHRHGMTASLMRLFPWMASDKAPLYATLFFAALAWTFVRTVDQLATTSFVEYHVVRTSRNSDAGSDGNVLSARFRNMTNAKPINCIVFFLSSTHPDSLEFVGKSIPRLHGSVFANGGIKINDKRHAAVTISEFPPGSDIEFALATKGEGKPAVLAKSCSNVANQGPLPIIVKRSLQTRLIANELPVLWFGLGVWAVLLVLISTARMKARSQRRA